MKKTTIPYYLSSIKSILIGFSNWYLIPFLSIIHPIQFVIKGKGVFIADNFMDVWTLKEVLIDDCYRINRLKKLDTVVDIGAAIGDFSILTSHSATQVISCEYDKNRLLMLRKNISTAKRKNITIIPKKIITLDSIISRDIQSCDLLKIDCEGSEYPILLNSKLSTIKKIKKMVGEIHLFNQEMKDNFVLLKNRLKKAGFTLKLWSNPVHDTICYFSASR